MSHAMNAAACKTLDRLGYEWKSLDGRHWDWYAPVPAVDVCRAALDDACVVSWINADLSTIEGAKKALAILCELEVHLATDPAINGGKTLQPVPAALAVDVANICNAYESGVGHRGRPTANVNPYREGTQEHEAYAIGAKGEAAQAEAKVADDVVLLPADATDEMQDNMRQALIDQGWDSDSAGEVDFADLWHAGVYEYQERMADMLAAKAKGE